MGRALEELGFTVAGVQRKNDPHLEAVVPRLIEEVVPLFDAFQDNPWPILYRTLDQALPGSKFILTLRDESSWLRSIVRHCGTRSTAMREWIYGFGNPVGHENDYLRVYARHNHDVQDYFQGRIGCDLLVLNLFEGDGWLELCPFLDIKDIPASAFPHLNKFSDKTGTRRLKSWIKAATRGNRSRT